MLNKYMIGGAVVMSIGLAGSLWALKASLQEAANERRDATIARDIARGIANESAERERALLARMEGIENALSGVQSNMTQNAENLAGQLRRLNAIQPKGLTTNENLECLDTDVPGVVGELLRDALRRAGSAPTATESDTRRVGGPLSGT